MNTDPPQHSATHRLAVAAWGVIAALLGLACFVAPAWLFPVAGRKPYGHPLFPWFEAAVATMGWPTMALFFVAGAVVAFAQPRAWALLGCLTLSLPLVLQAINIDPDITI